MIFKLFSKIIFFLTIFLVNCFSAQDIILTKEESSFLKNNPTIRVHNELNWPPYNYYEDGKAKGFSIDYMNLLAKKLNVNLKYISGPSWSQFLEMLQKDELDAMINISKNEERSKTIAFTSIFHTAANAIYVKEGNEDLDSLEKLEGKTIVMPKGFFAQKEIEKHYPKIKQILVDDLLESLKLLSLGKADATVGKKNVIDYIITLNNISGVVPTTYVNDNRMISLIRIGTSKKKAILRDILEKAQKSVSDQEILELKRKWFGTKDIQVKDKSNFLTQEEITYIQEKKSFKVCNQKDIKPIEFEENGIYQGITIDILDKIAELTKLRFEPVDTNTWEETKEFLKYNKCDFIPTVSNSAEVIDFAKTTNTYLNYKYAIITLKSKPVVSSLEEILDKKIAKKYDSELINLLNSRNPDMNILRTLSNKDSLEAVNSGQAYFALEPLPIATYYISNLNLENLYISRYTNLPYTINMAVSKENKLLLSILNKSLDMVTQAEHREIFFKWTSLETETIFDYLYFWEILFTLFILISIFSYRHYVLDKLNKNLTAANDEIEKKTTQISKQKILFETLYNKSADGVILIKKNRFVDCNESALKILKFNRNELINKTFTDISPLFQHNRNDSSALIKDYLNTANIEGFKKFEWIFTNALGQNIWVEIVLTAIEIEENSVLHTVIRDITQRKTLEQRLEDLNVNLEIKVKEEINKNEIHTQQLIQQSRLAQMGEMITMIAHQWRQPLSAISATTNNLIFKIIMDQKIEKDFLDKELKLISEYSQHLSLTIDDFRNFFKKDKEKIEFDLNNIIEKSLHIIKTSLDYNGINLEKDLKGNITLNSYPTELQQVILNILKNAEDALVETKIDNKKIMITTTSKNNFAILTIKDNAGGIEENIINKIFDPYFSTKDKKDGTGLGLYMSKIIINEHCNGSLKVTNDNNGAIFTIKLPLDKEEKNA